MSSLTKITETKRKAKRNKAGRKRKNKLGKKSTLSFSELFAAVDKANS
jgi:hypothetical protein